MYAEDDLLPLSGLQHFTFCERRWALIHIEGMWAENRFTAEGRELHERAHSGNVESRPGVLVRRTLAIHSFRLGLSGQADIVEFQPSSGEAGVGLPGRVGKWVPFPIEYKRRKDSGGSNAYMIQLCAQAICLEEMFGATVRQGAVYDGSTRRRSRVEFVEEMRRDVERAAARMHELHAARSTPAPVVTAACRKCSLYEICMPKGITRVRSAERYLEEAVRSAIQHEAGLD